MTEFLHRVWIQSQEVNSRLPVFTELPPGVSARQSTVGTGGVKTVAATSLGAANSLENMNTAFPQADCKRQG